MYGMNTNIIVYIVAQLYYYDNTCGRSDMRVWATEILCRYTEHGGTHWHTYCLIQESSRVDLQRYHVRQICISNVHYDCIANHRQIL